MTMNVLAKPARAYGEKEKHQQPRAQTQGESRRRVARERGVLSFSWVFENRTRLPRLR